MDWINYKFWRKNLPRVDAETAEFDLLIQRAKQRIVLSDKIRGCFELFQRASNRSKKIPEREY